MKPRNLVKPPVIAPKPAAAPVKPMPQRIEEGMDKLIEFELELEHVKAELLPQFRTLIASHTEKTVASVKAIAREHFDTRQRVMLTDLFEFLKSEPLWETKFVPGSQADRSEIESLYKQGWRYMQHAHDPKSKITGIMLHRPKLPATKEEFNSLYTSMLKAKELEPAIIQRKIEYNDKVGNEREEKAVKKAKPIIAAPAVKPIQAGTKAKLVIKRG